MVDNPLTTVDDLQKTILADQALTTKVLKITNSAYYGSNREVDTVSEAIVIMGFDTIKNLVLAVATREVYRNFGIVEQKLWEHSLGVSICASLVTRYCKNFMVRVEEAVVAGLLHDVGKVIMDNSQPVRFAELTQRVNEERVPYYSLENAMFGFNHAEVGYLLSQKWGFPQGLSNTIKMHHECQNNGVFNDNKVQKGLCLSISLSDAICARLGIGYRGPMSDLDLQQGKVCSLLGIEPAEIADIENLFKESYVREKLLFQG
jgi:putative nucleotidyltransferase with HDIG domain